MTAPIPNEPPMPKWLSFALKPDAMRLIHQLAFDTGRSKSDLVYDAIMKTYGEKRSPDATE